MWIKYGYDYNNHMQDLTAKYLNLHLQYSFIQVKLTLHFCKIFVQALYSNLQY